MAVSQDSTSLWYLPADSTEWTELLDGTTMSGPSNLWLCQEASGNLTDVIAGDTATLVNVFGTLAYQQAITGWTRDAITTTDGNVINFANSGTGINLGTTSAMMLAFVERTGTPADTRIIMGMGGALYANILSAWLDASNHLRIGTGTSPTAAGTVDHGLNTLVPIILQHDVTNSVQRIITPSETITQSFTAVSNEAGQVFLGTLGGVGGGPVGVAYWALWQGAAAEMSTGEITELLSRLEDGVPVAEPGITTLEAMQSGSMSMKWVALIEGCKYVLSDAPEAAVQAALAGTDWESADVINGLFVQMQNSQRIDPDRSFSGAGNCQLRVLDTTGADTFGTFIAKRLSGAETQITETVTRSSTTINVKSTTGFTSSGEIYLGTEAVGYSGVTATSFTGCTRGKYSPQGCDSSGSGGSRFANHHRYGVDARYINRQPLVTQFPRVWLGKRVSLYLHTWDGENLNSKTAAQLVFAGRIVGIADDPSDFCTVIDVEHAAKEWEHGVIGQDIWQADMVEGMWLAAGRKFGFATNRDGTALGADDLVVVTSGASTTNEMDEGFWSLSDLIEKINAWLAGEAAAARIHGTHSWASPVNHRGEGLRTVSQWHIAHGSSASAGWNFYAPAEVMAFLGLKDVEPAQNGATDVFASGTNQRTNTDYTRAGEAVPFSSVVFKPYGPGRVAQEFSEAVNYAVENVRGSFLDQRAYLPAALREHCPPGHDWGLFLLDDKALMVGSFDGDELLTNCWIAPYQATADTETDALTYIGRRADEPHAPVTLRQIFLLEGTASSLFKSMVYSTGVAGHNHTSDLLANGLGLGIPGSLLGAEFDNSVQNLPGADAPIAIVIDEPTKFSEIWDADLKIRRAFVRWRDMGFELGKWVTPTLAAALDTLEESNKAAPSGTEENHRSALQETDEFQKTSTKVDYARDFAVGRDGKYLKSVSVEDQAGADSGGNGATGGRSETLKMRNTFAQFANTGTSVEALIPGYMATTPMFSGAGRKMTRTIDLRYFEGLSVGDVVEVNDNFARDPLTGERGMVRAAIITRMSYDLGGPTPQGGKRDMTGEIEVAFLDVHRAGIYSPAADIDETYSSGGYSAGYLAAGPTLRVKEHAYSHSFTFTTKRGVVFTFEEDDDATHFEAGDKIVIVEKDPADPANPTTWSRTVLSVSGNDITLTATLSAPAWDAAKQYRVISADYATAQLSQQDDCYQADESDYLIQDEEAPYHLAITDEEYGYNAN